MQLSRTRSSCTETFTDTPELADGEVHSQTDHCRVVAEVRERLTVSKQAAQKFHAERLNLKKLNEAKGGEEYQPAM